MTDDDDYKDWHRPNESKEEYLVRCKEFEQNRLWTEDDVEDGPYLDGNHYGFIPISEIPKRDNKGLLHSDTGPALIAKHQYIYMKHGYVHRSDGPAAKLGYLDCPDYWYFYEGKKLGKNEEGWIKLWRITKNKDLFKCLGYTGPHGDTMHDLKNLFSLITQEDMKDKDDLYQFVFSKLLKECYEEYEEEYPALTDYEWDGDVTADA